MHQHHTKIQQPDQMIINHHHDIKPNLHHQNKIQHIQTVPHEHFINSQPQQNYQSENGNINYPNISQHEIVRRTNNNSFLQNVPPQVITQSQIILPNRNNNHLYHQNIVQSQIIGNENLIGNRSSKARHSLNPPIRQEIIHSRGELGHSLSPTRVISREVIQHGVVTKNDETINLRKELNLYKEKCNHLESHLNGPKNENTIVNIEIQNKLSVYMKEIEELRKKNLQLELSCEAIENERVRNERSKKNANQEKNYLVNEISKLRELLLLRLII